MTLEQRLSAAFRRIAQEIIARTGKLSDLATTNKTNLVAAINEVKQSIANAVGINDNASSSSSTYSSSKIEQYRNRSTHTGTQSASTIIDFADAVANQIQAQKGAINGVASLDSTGKVPSAQLPSFVDEVIERNSLAEFPATGSNSKIYVALDTNKAWRWGGSSYTEISPSPGSSDAVPQGVVNLYTTALEKATWNAKYGSTEIGNPDTDFVAIINTELAA
ncbi:hypothetical protein [Spirosoma sordidisoli]|uniref:Uncharacterized protein n=1 Tax=Spirosoma sordidisoli TaxID=2502893 RepID=A0A4Q2UMN7_9BACT|nr:hypothetical protein [Spirosoma sordidisoli]RYC70654.1 hypothetical protein EQG79_00445 [Spirosoma sordidisoli]